MTPNTSDYWKSGMLRGNCDFILRGRNQVFAATLTEKPGFFWKESTRLAGELHERAD